MAFQDEIMIRMGLDASGVKQNLKGVKGMIQGLKTAAIGGGLLNIFNITDSVTNSLGNFISRSKDLGSWWGAFSVGGIAATQQLDTAENTAAEIIRKGDIARKKNIERWAQEAKAIDERNKSIERGNKLLKDNQKIKDDNAEGELSFDDAIAANEKKLEAEKESLKTILEAGKSREEFALQERVVLDLEAKIANQIARQNALLQSQLEAKGNIARAENNRADLGKLTLEEIGRSTDPRLQADRQRASKAQDLQNQSDAARMRGESDKAIKLLEERDKVISGDPSKLTAFDRQKISDAERFKGTSLEGMFNARAQDALGRLNGIGSLKQSDKQTELQQANTAIIESRNALVKIEAKLEKLGTN